MNDFFNTLKETMTIHDYMHLVVVFSGCSFFKISNCENIYLSVIREQSNLNIYMVWLHH